MSTRRGAKPPTHTKAMRMWPATPPTRRGTVRPAGTWVQSLPTATSAPMPGEWERRQATYPEDHHAAPHEVTVDHADPHIVATLLGPDGAPIRQWADRPPVGFRR